MDQEWISEWLSWSAEAVACIAGVTDMIPPAIANSSMSGFIRDAKANWSPVLQPIGIFHVLSCQKCDTSLQNN